MRSKFPSSEVVVRDFGEKRRSGFDGDHADEFAVGDDAGDDIAFDMCGPSDLGIDRLSVGQDWWKRWV